jgi:Ca2+/Na+ antiporter
MSWIIAFIFIIASAIWVYWDAKKLKDAGAQVDTSPGTWAAAVILLWLAFFPLYFVSRAKYKKSIKHSMEEQKHSEEPPQSDKKEPSGKKLAIAVVVGVVVLGVIFGLIALVGSGASNSDNTTAAAPSGCGSPTLEQQAQAVDYKQLEKDPDSFNGTVAKFTGQIVQIEQSGNQGVIRLAVDQLFGSVWNPSDIVYISYQGNTDAVEGDVVNVYGPLTGSQTYTSQANFQITVPSMTGCVIEEASSSTSAAATAPTAPATPAPTQPQAQAPVQPVVAQPTPAPQAPAIPKTWHTVTTITAATTENTPPFTIQGSEWRATWSCQPGSSEDVPPSVFAEATDGDGGGMVATPSSCPKK